MVFGDGSLGLLVVASHEETALIKVYLFGWTRMRHLYVASVTKRLGISLTLRLLLGLDTICLNCSLNSLAFHRRFGLILLCSIGEDTFDSDEAYWRQVGDSDILIKGAGDAELLGDAFLFLIEGKPGGVVMR